MSNPVKKIFKGVKKVFKKVVKIVKKVLPIVVAAAAIYYGGYALANGTLTGSGTHLSSMITGGGMGQGGSLFVPGAGSNAANMLVGQGGVGQGWLGGSGFPGMGTQEGIATINNTTALNTEVASNVAMTESVDAAGNFTDLGQVSTTPSAPIDPATVANASPADFAPTNQMSPLTEQPVYDSSVNAMGSGAPDTTMMASDPYTAQMTGTPTTGGTFAEDFAIQSGQNSNVFSEASSSFGAPPAPSAALTTPPPMPNVGLSYQEQYFKNKILAEQATKEAAANAPWYSKAWSGLGDYGKMAAVQTGGNMLTGYAQGEAQEEENRRTDQKEQDSRNRLNAQRYGTYQYVPGVGIQYVPWNPATI